MIAAIAAALLGIAFVVAGGSKLAAGDAWPAQARDLGAPTVSIRPLPWIELAVGALLVVQLWRPVMAALAIALLVAFTALLVLRLSEGKRPPCACFGAWSATPIGPAHLVRNAGLVALGVVALVA